MTINGLVEKNKRVEIFKHYGDMRKFDKLNPYWAHDTKLSDYVNIMGFTSNYIQLICVFI
jgi:hypothetical protein